MLLPVPRPLLPSGLAAAGGQGPGTVLAGGSFAAWGSSAAAAGGELGRPSVVACVCVLGDSLGRGVRVAHWILCAGLGLGLGVLV